MKQNHIGQLQNNYQSLSIRIVFKGERLEIEVMRKKVLEKLDQAHMTIKKIKWRARGTRF